jgi:hypothetical protein
MNISFSKDGMDLSQKGLKYNLHSKRENWIQTLALEAETTISKLPTAVRDVYRKLVAQCIGTLQQNNPCPNHNTHPESITIKVVILTCHTDVLHASSRLQEYLNTLQSWLQTWKIKINESKSTYPTFTLRNYPSPPIYLNNLEIPSSTTVKYLDFTWTIS